MFKKFYDYKFDGEKIELSSPTMHGEELKYMMKAYETNRVSSAGENIDEIEMQMAEMVGCQYAVALSAGTSALHLAVKLVGEKLYGRTMPGDGALWGHRVFCPDFVSAATVNPVVYEGGIPVFIDTEYDTWNMDPTALERAFSTYPEVKLVVLAHLYGTPGKLDEIRSIAKKNGALIVEDAAESLGAKYKGQQTGSFGNLSCISFNGNKIITGGAGGMFLTDSELAARKARKFSAQAREKRAAWFQHEELGYNYCMNNVIAGVVRGQIPYLEEHISRKKEIYERYKEGLAGLPVTMNPYDDENSEPNFWLSCMMIDESAMCKQVRSKTEEFFIMESGKSCPTEILNALSMIHAEGRPVWKPMHLQPIYCKHGFITKYGGGIAGTHIYLTGEAVDVGKDIFARALCLPSDIKMTKGQQNRVIEVIRTCFD